MPTVIIDTQVDFMIPSGKLYVPGAEKTIPLGIQYLTKVAPYGSLLFTQCAHTESEYEMSGEADQYPIHCVPGTVGFQNVYNVQGFYDSYSDYADDVTVQEKKVFDMWEGFSPERDTYFDYLKEQGQLYLTVFGVVTEVCVKRALIGMLERGFQPTLLADLTVGISQTAEELAAELCIPYNYAERVM
jgi:nicotinamidase/pyrazinamidase